MKHRLLTALLRSVWMGIAMAAPAACLALEFEGGLSSGMVLQRDAAISIAGTGTAGSTLQVSFGGRTQRATVADNGRWQVAFEAMAAGGPHTLRAVEGETVAELDDLLIGDVWVFSGQSNMQMGLDEAVGGAAAIAEISKDPRVRILTMPKAGADTPAADPGAKWRRGNPESLRKFSAVAAFFAIHQHRQPALAEVPLGLIDSSFGGTSIEAWTPPGTLPDLPPDQLSASMFGISPGHLFNRMIAPLTSRPIRGVAWYQGEANAGRPTVYAALLQNLMRQWRQRWRLPELPFLVVQLPAFDGRMGDLDFSWLREAQAKACEQTPSSWLAVTYDTTAGLDLHPAEKEEIGRRLALLAAGQIHGLKPASLSPGVTGVESAAGELSVTFDQRIHPTASDIRGFSVAGADGDYRFASARIQGDRVMVRAPEVTEPKTVRYGWGGQPVANLTNDDGLPVVPFRTDAFPPRSIAFLPQSIAYRIEGLGYQLETGGQGRVASLVVGGKEFLSREPGGGSRILGGFGTRSLPKMQALAPDRLVFSDSSAALELHGGETALEMTLRNEGADPLEFRVALAPTVTLANQGKTITLTRDQTVLWLTGADAAEKGEILLRVEPRTVRTLRWSTLP